MVLNKEEDIINLIREDEWMLNLLKIVNKLNLPDWWICAGFVRSKIWDVMHGFSVRTPIPDIDVIYFDSTNLEESEEKQIEERLKLLAPDIPWSVKNQARMHIINRMEPYSSSVDAITNFPETVTALGVKLDEEDNVLLTAPWGVYDVINLIVKPTPHYQSTIERIKVYQNRVEKKNWDSIWFNVKVENLY